MPSSHLILYRPLLLLPPIPPSLRVFSNESTLHIRWPKYWSFSFSISPSNEHPGLISFRMDCLDLLAVQGTLKSLLQHHSSKASIFRCSAFFTVQLSHPYMTTGKTTALSWHNSKRKKYIYIVKVAQSLPTLCNPMDYAVCGLFQVRIQEWVAFPYSRGSSQPRDQAHVSCIADRFFTDWAIRETHNSKNWPQRKGNTSTLKLKINCPQHNQEDADQATNDQFQDDCQTWLCCFYT